MAAVPAEVHAAEPALVLEGNGDGHGVGMAQDGALAMGRAGADTATILGAFYPGTQAGTRHGTVSVRIDEGADMPVAVVFPGGGSVTAGEPVRGLPLSVPPGRPITLANAGGAVRVRMAEELSPIAADVSKTGTTTTTTVPAEAPAAATSAATPTTTSTTAVTTTSTIPGTTTTAAASRPNAPPTTQSDSRISAPEPPATPRAATLVPAPKRPSSPATDLEVLVPGGVRLQPRDGSTTLLEARKRAYRGVVDVGLSPGGLTMVNRLDVETYLKGMGEVLDPSWPPAALQAQAVAARTYALRAMATAGEICDDDRCQVYIGAQAEYGAMSQAVDDTAGEVLTYGGGLASTVYSSSAGGYTATPAEGFGPIAAGYPYLVAAPYETADRRAWSAAFSLADVGRRLGYAGKLARVDITRAGPSGRAVDLSVKGDAGPMPVTGVRFAALLSLPSTLFRIATGDVPVGPVAAAPASGQVLPDDVATILRAPPADAAFHAPSAPAPQGGNAAHVVASELGLLIAGAVGVEARRRRRRALRPA